MSRVLTAGACWQDVQMATEGEQRTQRHDDLKRTAAALNQVDQDSLALKDASTSPLSVRTPCLTDDWGGGDSSVGPRN